MKMRTVKIVGAAGLLLAAVTVFALWRLGNGVDPDDAGVSTVSTIRPAERILTEEQKRALAEYQERVRKHREEALARGDSEGEYEVVRTTGCVGHYFEVTASLDEMALKAAVIARVRFREVEAVGVRLAHDLANYDDVGYNGSLRFTLDVFWST